MLSLALLAIFPVRFPALAAGAEGPPSVQVSGNIVHEYRLDDNGAGNPAFAGHKTIALMNFRRDVTANFSIFARSSFEYISNAAAKPAFADFAGSSNNGSLDSFGCRYENAGYKYSLGLQSFVLGPTMLLYDGSFAYGRHSLPLALNIAGKVGTADATAIVGRTNYYGGHDDRFFVVQGFCGLNGKSTVGALWARVGYGLDGGNHDYHAVSFSHKLSPKVTLTVECLKADFREDNFAYTGVINFAIDAKNRLHLADWRVERNATIFDRRFGYMTTYLGDAAGQMLVWQHTITKNLMLAVVDLNFAYLHDDGTGGRRNSLRGKLIYSF